MSTLVSVCPTGGDGRLPGSLVYLRFDLVEDDAGVWFVDGVGTPAAAWAESTRALCGACGGGPEVGRRFRPVAGGLCTLCLGCLERIWGEGFFAQVEELRQEREACSQELGPGEVGA